MKTTSIFVITGLLLLLGMWIGYRYYNKEHREVDDEKSIVVSAINLFNDFSQDEDTANKKYLNKVLEVTGTVRESMVNQQGSTVLVLETNDAFGGVTCTLESEAATIKINSEVTIKGICTGYLADVIIIQAKVLVTPDF